MTRLAKYLKPYTVLLLLSIALLFVQANADLALPDYMSRIVNVGIQQSGIKTALPDAIRKTEMDNIGLFLTDENKGRILQDYVLVEPGSSEEATYVAKYPAVSDVPVYVLKNIDGAERSAITSILAPALVVVGGIDQISKNPDQAKSMTGAMSIDLSKLPPGTNIFTLLKVMPAATRTQLASAFTDKLNALGPSAIAQAAVVQVKSEYDALGMNTARIQSSYIVSTGAMMLLLSLLSAACTVTVGFLSARIAAGLSRDLRAGIFERVESFASGEFDKFSTATLITRSTNDIMQIQMVSIMIIRMVFYAPIIGVGGIIRAIGKSSSMWWVIALAVGVLLVLIFFVYKVAVPKFKIMQKLMDRLNLVSREGLSGMMVIRAFNMQPHEEKRFDVANSELTATTLFVNRVMVVMMPFMMLIMNGLSLLIIWVGAHQVANSSMQVGDMMAFLQYAMQIVFAFLMLSMMFIMLPRAAVSADRVADVLETEPSIVDPPEPETYNGSNGNGTGFEPVIEFRDVSFRYPGAEADALHNITFTALPGKTTAFIGATGSGKSTLVNLIPRFYDITSGEILVGGKDVRKVSQHDVRDKIGFVPQKAVLFSGTIASNLRYADENADEATVGSAVSIAQAEEFVNSSETGLETPISQGGINVSGGQKQRLSIARALVKRPPIFIFDDSFSALDFKTDSNLRRALKRETGSSTVLIVTQRVSTIINADQIIVLDEGRIVGTGTHQELMQNCETYREIATSQLTSEELA